MKKQIKFVVAVFAAGFIFCTGAAEAAREYIWPTGKMPDRQAHQIAAMTNESGRKGFDRSKFQEPYLDWYEAPANSATNRPCMILISGGSYQCCCDVGLIKQWRETFTKLGCQCVNFVYRTPRPKGLAIYQTAWEDGQRAVRVVRSQAAKRGFDPEKIGVIGMSAGGHLTVMLATSALTSAYQPVDDLDKLPCHINWAIANAPAYNTLGGATGNPTPQDGTSVIPSINPCFKFDAKTCPISFHHGGRDPYTPNGSTLCYRELRKRKIPTELHLYADLKHGAHGLERGVEFMRQMGFLGKLGREVDLMKRYPNDNARAGYEKQLVWPEGKMPNRKLKADGKDAQCTPYIEWHQPKTLKTRAIQIIYSGGGYGGNSPDGFEVAPMRRYLNEKGMTVVTMRYRTPRPKGLAKHVTAWQDLQRAIRLVRSQAAARGLDPDRIGIMGSSAGGHLTLMGAFSSKQAAYPAIDELDKISCTVQWGIPIYPAYALTDGADCHNKTGGNDDAAVPVPEFAFDAGTCPLCFIHGDADGWASMNSVKCWEKLRLMGIQCDLHTLALRPHCFQRKAAPGTGSYTWMDRAWDFLSRKGFNK